MLLRCDMITYGAATLLMPRSAAILLFTMPPERYYYGDDARDKRADTR